MALRKIMATPMKQGDELDWLCLTDGAGDYWEFEVGDAIA